MYVLLSKISFYPVYVTISICHSLLPVVNREFFEKRENDQFWQPFWKLENKKQV